MAKVLSQQDTPLLEWIVGACGATIFATMIGTLAYGGLSEPRRLADIQVNIDRVERTASGYVAELKIRNDGDTTGGAVEVVASAVCDGEVQERSVQLDYVPRHSERRAGMFFTCDPRGNVTFQVQGYAKP